MDALKALRSMGMGEQVEGPGGDKLLQQAQHVWSMLDDMASQDPDSYKRFIDKQTAEFKEMNAPPKPYMCVRTQLQGAPLYVNIMSWQRVPKPKSAQDSVPLFAGSLDNYKDKKAGETVSTMAIATNPEVLSDYGVEAKDAEERRSFINLTLDYVQHLCSRPVSRDYTLLPQSTQFKGDLEKAQTYFTDALKKAMKKDKQGQENSEKSHAPDIDSDLPDSMLSKLANISASGEQESRKSHGSNRSSRDTPILFPEQQRQSNGSSSTSSVGGTPIVFPGAGGQRQHQAEKKTLIQEVVTTPLYTVDRSESGLVMTIQLPGVTSVSQCELDISQDDVKLVVEGLYELTAQLPAQIDDTQACAKFSKKLSQLTLTMPLAQS